MSETTTGNLGNIITSTEEGVEAFFSTVETELQDFWQGIEGEAETDIAELGLFASAVFTQFTSSQSTILTAAAKKVVGDVLSDPLLIFNPQQEVTTLIEYLEAQEETDIVTILTADASKGSVLATAILSLAHIILPTLSGSSTPSASTTAAPGA